MDEGVRHKPDLKSRDVEILLLVGEGLQNKEIAGRLALSMKTVEFHKRRLYSKIWSGRKRWCGAVCDPRRLHESLIERLSVLDELSFDVVRVKLH